MKGDAILIDVIREVIIDIIEALLLLVVFESLYDKKKFIIQHTC